MPQILMPYTVHLDHTLRVTPLSTLFAKGDSAAHRFELTILRAGVQEDLTGCTVLCKFYRMADSAVVSVPGFVEDGKAVSVLKKACYDYIGRFALTIAIKNGEEEETTVFYGDGYMHGQNADTAISGEYIIYDINTLLEKIAEIDSATQAANTATENANTAASNANTARDAANTAANTANTAATNANTAKDAANAAAGKIDNMTVSATPVDTGTATADLSTVDGHYHLSLGLPKGDTGATPRISVQVQTGAAGSEAHVSVSGTAEKPVIILTIPKGDTGDIGALTINGKTPDAAGSVTLEIADIDGLSEAIANAGGVKTVAGVAPDSAGNVALNPADLGAATAEEVSSLKDDIAPLIYNNAGAHNAVYRGKNLGTSVTAAQWAAIANGTFTDMFIGDYWEINGITWRIAAFDYWYNFGDVRCETHHVVIVPDETILNADGSTTHWMNATGTAAGAYVGSDFYTGNNGNTGKSQCLEKAQSAFGSAHILTHREYLANAVTNGYESGGAWYDSQIEIPSEKMVYGCSIFGNQMSGTNIPALSTMDHTQLPLFVLDRSKILNPVRWFLRDVVSGTAFAIVHHSGFADYEGASNPWVSVRPAFGIRA